MTHSSKNYQVIYRYKDSLAGCFVWAPDEDQAEKKFKARKEFEYDPDWDPSPNEGNIRSIYEYQPPLAKKKTTKIDELKKFVMFPELAEWFQKYDSGKENSLAKQIPLTEENINVIDHIAKVIPIVRRYRGPRSNNIHRECLKKDAQRVSIYARN